MLKVAAEEPGWLGCSFWDFFADCTHGTDGQNWRKSNSYMVLRCGAQEMGAGGCLCSRLLPRSLAVWDSARHAGKHSSTLQSRSVRMHPSARPSHQSLISQRGLPT